MARESIAGATGAGETGDRKPRAGIDRLLLSAGVILLASSAWHLLRPPALVEARAAYATGSSQLRLKALRRALDDLDDHPRNPDAAKIAALSLSQLDYAQEAEPYYRLAGPLGHAEFHVRTYGLVRANRRLDAIKAYQEILARWPADVLALSRLGAVLYSQKRYSEALDVAKRMETTAAGRVRGYTLEGVIDHDRGDYDLAIAAFEQVLTLDRDLKEMPLPQPAFWGRLAYDLLEMGRAADARMALNRALSEHDDPALMDLLGRAYAQDGLTDEAERWWRKALGRDPRDSTAWFNLGRLALQQEGPAQAIPLLEKAATFSPDAIDPLYNLALAHRRLGHEAEARDYQKRLDQLKAKGGTGAMARGMGPKTPAEPDPLIPKGFTGDQAR